MRQDSLEHLQWFYAALLDVEGRTGGRRRLGDCAGRMNWPERGVYFFFEPGEERSCSGSGHRVVRVGTHALKSGAVSTLWGRLSQHRGSNLGGGNHRGSIFRLLIGQALLRKSQQTVPSWGVGGTIRDAAARVGTPVEQVREIEASIEAEVSRELAEMTVVWIDVADLPSPESLRGTIERNSIALLSAANAGASDPASPGWLGNWSGREAVRASGLWNNNHVREAYDPAFMRLLRA